MTDCGQTQTSGAQNEECNKETAAKKLHDLETMVETLEAKKSQLEESIEVAKAQQAKLQTAQENIETQITNYRDKDIEGRLSDVHCHMERLTAQAVQHLGKTGIDCIEGEYKKLECILSGLETDVGNAENASHQATDKFEQCQDALGGCYDGFRRFFVDKPPTEVQPDEPTTQPVISVIDGLDPTLQKVELRLKDVAKASEDGDWWKAYALLLSARELLCVAAIPKTEYEYTEKLWDAWCKILHAAENVRNAEHAKDAAALALKKVQDKYDDQSASFLDDLVEAAEGCHKSCTNPTPPPQSQCGTENQGSPAQAAMQQQTHQAKSWLWSDRKR